MSETMLTHYESKRNVAHKRLSDAVTCARSCAQNPTRVSRLETWCSRLDQLMDTFNDAHVHLLSELKKLKIPEDQIQKQNVVQEEADDMYFEILEAKRVYLHDTKLNESLSENKKSNTKLPPMKLPSFSGSLKDFPGFIDLFNTLVHNRTDLSNVEKFQYLSTSLSGEPINVIRAFPISEANYNSAYEALISRYDNKRYLAFTCWEQIINSKQMHAGSVQNLRGLLDTYNENLSILHTLGLPIENWDFVLFHSLITKLDKGSREAFELSCKSTVFPTFEELKTFLLDRCIALERSTLTNSQPSVTSNQRINKKSYISPSQHQSKTYQSVKNPTMLLARTSSNKCFLCKGDHPLYACPSFLSKSPHERSLVVKQHKLCMNCLRSNHSTSNCLSSHSCKTCNQRHNSLLHFPSKSYTNQSNSISSGTQSTSGHQAITSDSVEDVITPITSLSNTIELTQRLSFVLLATAEVEVKDNRGIFQMARVLIDPGSQSHIITESCVRRLGLSRYRNNTPLSGIGDTPAHSASKVFLEIRPLGKTEPIFTMEALTLNKICSEMPSHQVNMSHYQHIANVKLADQQFNTPRPIDILIGGEMFPQILLPGKIEGDTRAATAINTVFGFILMGKTMVLNVVSNSTPHAVNHLAITHPLDTNLDIAIQKFWESDTIPTVTLQSADDIQCENIYQSTHERDVDGRYIVQLPFKDSEPTFNDSYSIALRRFKHLERRFIQNPTFGEQYKAHIMEYLSSNHMEVIPRDQHQSPTAYYIPHHAVLKPSSLSTKLRVVYDASAKDKAGVSLNDTLLTGCKLQADITNIILRFRLHAIVMSADVRQMYRQIIVKQNHTDYQRILFRCSPNEPIQEYRLNRVTFGVSSAPFLAIRTLHQLSQDEAAAFPAAANVLINDLYVDDVVTGCDLLPTALSLQQQLIGIMSAGGFELRKWSSNHEAVLNNVPADHRTVPNLTFDNDTNFVKVLGLAWHAKQDIFKYEVNQITRSCTKRTMLSELARIYDPIGLLTPLTFLAKFLIQRLWLLGTSWDEPVPDDINQIWTKYIQQLSKLKQLHIPRRITCEDATSYQLHGFCDASEAGYAAVVYLRSSNNHDHNHHVALVSAKSRVSPTKRRTLPRLELCGASLLADLLQYIMNTYSPIINIASIHAWTDSMITLTWIQSKSTNFKAYVGNRVANIQRKIPTAAWKHVPGSDNPADCASRGLVPDDLIKHKLWWHGPEWLALNEEHWPSKTDMTSCVPPPEVACELRSTVLSTTIGIDTINTLIHKFSSLRKIQRIIAYCRRFLQHKHNHSIHFTEHELHEALMVLVKYVQQSEFANEQKALSSGRVVSKSIRKLSPFLDSAGILRVGGRLSLSHLDFNTKHPALLPRNHRLTELIIQNVHNEHLHPGLQTMQYLLRQNFWILSSKRCIQKVLSKCYRCFRIKPIAVEPKMADLPKARVTRLKAFQSVGCDYAGPFNITLHRRRGARTIKSYLCLFVCFVTKALHLELASDLSTEAFLAALRRFVARRGRCNTIHSDCGTNFKGAQSQLADIMRSACETERIDFKFNPPGAPHFGGLWEAGIKSVKTHLYRVIGKQILSYEELNTLLTQVEAILNSRPLCPMSSDPNDLSVLTPGHFLTLAPLTAVPTPNYTDISINRLTRWQLLQRMHQDFWFRWHQEYLTNLSQRLKWTQSLGEIHKDQVVIIKDESHHPLRWQFGRIIELYPGRDQIPRAALVRTAHGVIKRPLVKLCPIPSGHD